MAINSEVTSRQSAHGGPCHSFTPFDELDVITTRLCLGFGAPFREEFLFDSYCSANELTAELRLQAEETAPGVHLDKYIIHHGTFESHPQFEKHTRSLLIGTEHITSSEDMMRTVRKIVSIVKACPKLGRLTVCLANETPGFVKNMKFWCECFMEMLNRKENRSVRVVFVGENWDGADWMEAFSTATKQYRHDLCERLKREKAEESNSKVVDGV